MLSWPKGRKEPYTERGIRRVPCIRCGAAGRFQWSFCADGNVCRVLCQKCDIELNELVLRWAGDPDIDLKMNAYRNRVYGPS